MVSETRHVKHSRKSYCCDWCGERIEVGDPYKSWFTFGEAVTARMHSECYAAMGKADLYDDDLPPTGTFRRGCWCGESIEHCTCVSKPEKQEG